MWLKTITASVTAVLPLLCSAVPALRADVSPAEADAQAAAVSQDSVSARRTAGLVRAALQRSGVAESSAVTLWRYYSCMSETHEECAPSLKDTVEADFRMALRRQLGRCSQGRQAPAVIVQVSRARVRGDSVALLVDVSVPGDPTGNQSTYLARVPLRSPTSDAASKALREIYHATYVPGTVEPGILLDDTCRA